MARGRGGTEWKAGGTILASVLVVLTVVPAVARAGPPYLTDDPDPVAYHHWELYLGSQWDQIERGSVDGSLPHVEVNFGVVPGAMLHVRMPAQLVESPDGSTAYGPGDLELGANIRIVKEGARCPQIGTFPIAVLPTGSESRGLGSGTVQLFLPIWLMKTVGPWVFDGGGGIRFSDDGDDAELGTFIQRSFGQVVTLGAEVFVTVPFDGTHTRTQLDAALILDLTDVHHLLMSGGPSFGAVGGGQAYFAWLVTI